MGTVQYVNMLPTESKIELADLLIVSRTCLHGCQKLRSALEQLPVELCHFPFEDLQKLMQVTLTAYFFD
jgi:hypothetical protein